MKKVLVVASVISFIEWFNKENIRHLSADLGCEVHIAVNADYFEDTDKDRTVKYLEKIKSEGIIIHNIHFARSPLSKDNIHAYRQLKKLIDSEHFDLIHCHTPAASILTRLAARKARRNGTMVMYTCHGFHFHDSSPRRNWLLYYPVERFMSRFCDYIVTINKEDYNRAKSFHCKNVRYIPGVGVDITEIKNTVIDRGEYKEKLGLPRDCVLILSVGELIERKNHEVIIKALSKIDHEKIYYAIAGKGPLHEYLSELSRSFGLAEHVKLLGFRTDIPELCNAADISAFPSKIEGLGLAGIEAMAAGVPLVSSDVHGILDYVIDGVTGYAYSPDDADGFAEGIERLASDSGLRTSMRDACIKAAEPFGIENALKVMWSIYEEAL